MWPRPGDRARLASQGRGWGFVDAGAGALCMCIWGTLLLAATHTHRQTAPFYEEGSILPPPVHLLSRAQGLCASHGLDVFPDCARPCSLSPAPPHPSPLDVLHHKSIVAPPPSMWWSNLLQALQIMDTSDDAVRYASVTLFPHVTPLPLIPRKTLLLDPFQCLSPALSPSLSPRRHGAKVAWQVTCAPPREGAHIAPRA